ncbi:MAG: phosphoribosylformimino-5-aminoimidazole carboxamide ribotide isomerase [Eubacterium sp.]|nr:phosphoribosylformimino-5-aminoimidazole carboxamide ribotide isomerase [Eubacterium sp.]
MEFRPCIDIHNGAVKQIVGGSLRDAGDAARENFVSGQDAAFYARLYQQYGIRGGHVILLNPASSDYYEATRAQALAALAAWPGGLQAGGGITPENAGMFLDAGASHVIVTSYVFREGVIDYDRLGQMVRAVGRDRLVLDLSCRKYAAAKQQSLPGTPDSGNNPSFSAAVDDSVSGDLKPGHYYVVTDRWQRFTGTEITKETLAALSRYCDEFLIHAADVEGMQQGVDAELISILADFQASTTASDSADGSTRACRLFDTVASGRSAEKDNSPDQCCFPVTYAGGVGSFEDLKLLKTAGKNRLNVTIGSALDLFGGSMSFEEVLRAMN